MNAQYGASNILVPTTFLRYEEFELDVSVFVAGAQVLLHQDNLIEFKEEVLPTVRLGLDL